MSGGDEEPEAGQARGLTRRELLLRGGAATAAVFLPLGCGDSGQVAVPVGQRSGASAGAARFLAETELATLRALVDRFVPADSDPGAAAAGCADAIDALLGAFAVSPPRIYAGAPFSDRGGAPVNGFEQFLPLDDYETLAWRLRIEGSRGDPALEFNGPVRGYQAVYREGLAALDEAAQAYGATFAGLPGPVQDVILRTSQDAAIAALVDIAFPHTLQFMYGAPEYGGNRDLVAWKYTNFDGDTQPRGYSREQVENPDNPGLPELLPPLPELPLGDLLAPALKSLTPLTALAALAPLASPEAMHGLLARSGDSLGALRAEIVAALNTKGGRRGA